MGLLARFRSSLTYPIAATLVLVTVVPVVTVGLLLAARNREHLTTTEKQYLTRQAVSLASEVALFFSLHRTQLESTVRALAVSEPLDLATRQSLLEEMTLRDQSFALLWLVDRTGEAAVVQPPQVSDAGLEVLVERLREAHETALGDEPVRNLTVALTPPDAGAVIYGYPLRSPRSGVWGTLDGAVDLGPLQSRLRDNTYAGLIVTIVDGDGNVVISSEEELSGKNLSDSRLVASFRQNPLRLTQIYEHPVSSVTGEVLGSVAPIEGWRWGVLVERPVRDAFATVRAMQQRTLLVTALAALVALAIGFGLSRQLTRPIQNLAETTTEIAEGNLAVRADVRGDDELARLSSNFNDMAANIEELVRRLRQALRQNQELFLETIRTLAAAIDAKDPYTRGHSERVSAYSLAIAKHLGLGQDQVFRVRIAAILHDVGKLGIRDGILNKPGGLTDEEFTIMRRHAEIGAQIMAPIRTLRDIIPGIRNHHEAWDGSGYPDRLKEQAIPLVARIIGVADTFDAMTTTRPYQKAMSLDYVIAKMRSMSGARFDPDVVEAFLAAVAAGDMTPPPRKPPAPEPAPSEAARENVS
jgi:putative nucleotidyltransferase with HDIG domain